MRGVDQDDHFGVGAALDPWAGAPRPRPTPGGGAFQPKPVSPPKQDGGWGNFQAGQATAPDPSWDDRRGGGRNSGRGWRKANFGPSGPDLPRQRVSAMKLMGRVLEWKGKYGWIEPAEPVDHPKASMRSGRIFISKTDLVDLYELEDGALVEFFVFEDEAGLGAEECHMVGVPPNAGMRPPGPNRFDQQGFPRGCGGRGGRGVVGGGRGLGPDFGAPGVGGPNMRGGSAPSSAGLGGGRGKKGGKDSDKGYSKGSTGKQQKGRGGGKSRNAGNDDMSLPGYVPLQMGSASALGKGGPLSSPGDKGYLMPPSQFGRQQGQAKAKGGAPPMMDGYGLPGGPGAPPPLGGGIPGGFGPPPLGGCGDFLGHEGMVLEGQPRSLPFSGMFGPPEGWSGFPGSLQPPVAAPGSYAAWS